MDVELKEAFTRIKPVCDRMMSDPSSNNISACISRVSELKKDTIQELQQYILYPFMTHINTVANENKFELQRKFVEGVRVVMERITLNSYEMCMKFEIGLLQFVFDKNKPSMIAEIPEELKLSVIRCQTALLLNTDNRYREMLMNSHVPLLAQAVFVAIHMAKLDKLRSLRLAAIHCVTAHTGTHANLTENYHITSPSIEMLVVDMLSSILPGVLAGLQDVATCSGNPGHAIVVAAIDAIHRILCITMNDKFLTKKNELTPQDFYNMIIERSKQNNTDVSNKKIKDLLKRSPEWYAMAGNKLILVTKNLVALRTHEHFKVRKELAIFCYRLLTECNLTMQPSVPLAIDVLVSLTKDEYPEVAQYCTNSLETFFANASDEVKNKTLDSMCDNFFGNLTCLPRVMNNIDSNRKSNALNLLAGYVSLLSGNGSSDGSFDRSGDASDDGSGDGSVHTPQRLTAALSVPNNMQCLCYALLEAAALRTDLTVLHRQFTRDINTNPTSKTPWITLRHLESKECELRLQEICQSLGNAESAELLVDRLMEMFLHQRETEAVYIMNWIAAGSNSPLSLVHRLINTYIEEDLWYLPLEIGSTEKPLTKEDTLDESVYNPRAWSKDSVPGLFEGAIEIRYTDISYQTPRAPPYRERNTCANLAEAQKNMLLSCLLTEGLGMMATRLKEGYQPYLMKTLCLVLERVGGPYEMLHLAGIKTINDIASACGHSSVPDLIRCNADYFTNQVTVRLKKAWNSESALQILSVVMEYSDTSLLDCLYGIVQDVLVQSCDKYYEKNLNAYLQVFLTFVICIRKWFPVEEPHKEPLDLQPRPDVKIDVLKDVREFVKNKQDMEKLLNNAQMERESGKTVEEMYKEDMKKKEEEDALDYEDTVIEEKAPLPQHVVVTTVILKRCLHFVTSQCQETAMLTLQILTIGLPVLATHEDELLPIVHLMWAPFVTKFTSSDAPVMRRGFDLLVVMSSLAKDFIRVRMLREVLPHVYAFLRKAAADSHLKDAGSAYRQSHAYRLQEAALTALPRLLLHLRLPDDRLHHLLAAAHPYLSSKQPKPLQILAVDFYRTVMRYDYGTLWRHLTEMCKNEQILIPPTTKNLKLEPVVGTPFVPKNQEFKPNIQQIFDYMIT